VATRWSTCGKIHPQPFGAVRPTKPDRKLPKAPETAFGSGEFRIDWKPGLWNVTGVADLDEPPCDTDIVTVAKIYIKGKPTASSNARLFMRIEK
jgi:hypothetical protein